jgi:hypothetical protein
MRSTNFVPGIAGKTAHFVAQAFAQGLVTVEEVKASVSATPTPRKRGNSADRVLPASVRDVTATSFA